MTKTKTKLNGTNGGEKMTKSIKRICVMLVLVLASIVAGFFTMGSSKVSYAESTLAVNHFNLSFRDNVCIKFAVETNVENTKLLLWTEVSNDYQKGTEEVELETVGIQIIEEQEHQVFDYTNLYAKNMTDDVYVRAYASVDDKEFYSPVKKYSILQYAYNKLGKTGIATEDEELKVALVEMLEYGAAVQKYLDYNLERLATDNFVQVNLSGGTLPDGFTDGLYKVGSTVTITAPQTSADGGVFMQWVDQDNNVIAETPTYSLTVGEENNTYTPVYQKYSQGLAFTSNGNGTCGVTGIGTCTDTDIVIPSTYMGSPVTSIGSSAFEDCKNLTSVEIPDGVTTIGRSAFYGCDNLDSVVIPNTVKGIGYQAFYNCNNLQYTVYENGKYLGSETNAYLCLIGATSTDVTSLNIHTATKVLGGGAFRNCSKLTSVDIPNGIITIGDNAFQYCSGLTSIIIPDSITSIGGRAFYDCRALTKINFSATAMEDLSESHNIFGGVGLNGTGITVRIGANVTRVPAHLFNSSYHKIQNVFFEDGSVCSSIGEYAFEECSSMVSIDIPCTITSIGESAFSGCRLLERVYYDGTIDDWVMMDFETSASNPLYYGDLYIDSVKITQAVLAAATSINDYAFYYSSLTSVVIPDSVTSIGDYAFYGCSGLTSMTIGKDSSLTTIGAYAFYNCSKLTSMVIPNKVTSMGDFAFYGCIGLTSIEIPDGVTTIGDCAFRDCKNLAGIIVDSDNTAYQSIDGDLYTKGGETLVQYATGKTATTFTVPESVISIGPYSFGSYGSLTSIEILDNVTLIDPNAFKECNSLASITVSENNRYYASQDGILYNKEKTDIVHVPKGIRGHITLPDSITNIGENVFSWCSGLTSIEIPDGVTTIGDGAFYYCDSLTSITIPDSVTSIGGYAFSSCSSLTSITIPDGVTSIGDEAFYGCSRLTIYCEVASKPSGWSSSWNYNKRPVIWNYAGVMVTENGIRYVLTNNGTMTVCGYEGIETEVEIASTVQGYSVTEINQNAFSGERNLTSITIPDSITTIGLYAFQNCSGLTSIIIPDSITSIGTQAFYGCSSLTIYCEATSKPSGWSYYWNYSNCLVEWGYTGN